MVARPSTNTPARAPEPSPPTNGCDAPAGVHRALPWLLAVSIAAFLLWPLIEMAATGITLTGMAEESVGYRYFYTLRILYANHERPWLPQGQLAGLAHLGIQLALTASGYPPEQLFPRIDLFAYAASALPSILTAVAFVWAVRPMRDASAQLVVALLLLFVVIDVRSGRGVHLVQADYYTWVHPIALLTIGAMLRVVERHTPLNPRTGLAIGLFAAVAFTIKPTHLIFVLPVGLLLLVHAVRKRRVLGAVLGSFGAVVAAILGVVGITCAYYLGDLAATGDYFVRLASFVDAVTASGRFGEWLIAALQHHQQPNPLTLGVLLVPVLILSCLALPNRSVSLCLLPGALASVYLSWRRYYPNTLIETNDYTFVIVVAWATLVLVPAVSPRLARIAWPRSRSRPRWVTPLSLAGLISVVFLGLMLMTQAPAARLTVLSSFRTSTDGARELADYLTRRSGRVAFLIPDGQRRPTTVDSAIYKGGTNISDTTWGVSPYVASLFPDRAYFIGTPTGGPNVDLSVFARIVFVSVPSFGGDADAAKRLWEHFRVPLAGLDCGFRVDLRHHEVVVCERPVITLAPGEARTAVYYAGDAAPAPGAVAGSRAGSSHIFAAGDLVYWREKGVWQLQEAGHLIGIEAAEGTRLAVGGVGAWNERTGGLAGLDAIYLGGRWELDTSNFQAANADPRFRRTGSLREPLPGWRLAPNEHPPSVERLSDDTGPFVRLRPGTPGAQVILYNSQPLSRLDGAPAALRAQVRVRGDRPATMTLFDVVDASNRAVTHTKSTTSSDRWETLFIQAESVQFPSPGDNFSLALSGAAEGGFLDVRELSVRVGVWP